MLADYPTILDGVQLPFTDNWDESYETVEVVKKSEAGTDISAITRFDKLTVKTGYICMESLARQLKASSCKTSVVLRMYDLNLGGYSERNVRMRNFTAKRVDNTEKIENTNGIWEISFSLIEI